MRTCPSCGADLLTVIALAALIPALAPPSMGDWDSLAYHLAVPKLYLEHGGIYHIDFIIPLQLPVPDGDALHAGAGDAQTRSAAKLMNYWVGVLLVLAVVVLVSKHFNAKAAPMAAIAVAGMPIVLWEATTAYVDLATALYTVVAVHLLLNYLDKPERRA